MFGKKLKSEKNKLLKLLNNYSLSIDNNNLDALKQKIKKKNINRLFNQPICFNTKETIYFKCNQKLIEDILKIKENDYSKLLNKKYIICEILKRNLINKLESANELVSLISFITYSEKKDICDFFLNMVESKSYTNDVILEEICKKYGYEIEVNKMTNKKQLKAKDILYDDPQELCIENISNENYEKCEKYNFNYLEKNPPLNININKIKEFLIQILSSNVFKEAFVFLTGRNDYYIIFDKKFIS